MCFETEVQVSYPSQENLGFVYFPHCWKHLATDRGGKGSTCIRATWRWEESKLSLFFSACITTTCRHAGQNFWEISREQSTPFFFCPHCRSLLPEEGEGAAPLLLLSPGSPVHLSSDVWMFGFLMHPVLVCRESSFGQWISN